jgi:hypothetical protein
VDESSLTVIEHNILSSTRVIPPAALSKTVWRAFFAGGRRLKRNVVICAAVVACAIGVGSSAVFGESNPLDNQSEPAKSSRPAAGLPAQLQGRVPQGETGPLEAESDACEIHKRAVLVRMEKEIQS